MSSGVQAFADRPKPKTLVLFDVDVRVQLKLNNKGRKRRADPCLAVNLAGHIDACQTRKLGCFSSSTAQRFYC